MGSSTPAFGRFCLSHSRHASASLRSAVQVSMVRTGPKLRICKFLIFLVDPMADGWHGLTAWIRPSSSCAFVTAVEYWSWESRRVISWVFLVCKIFRRCESRQVCRSSPLFVLFFFFVWSFSAPEGYAALVSTIFWSIYMLYDLSFGVCLVLGLSNSTSDMIF